MIPRISLSALNAATATQGSTHFVTTMGFLRKCWPMEVFGVMRLRTVVCACSPCVPLRACFELIFGLRTFAAR
jgi:hypothetical protein